MLIGLEAILPLFIIIGCGYLARRTLLDESMLPAVNVFVYYFAVPALLFRAAMEMSLEGDIESLAHAAVRLRGAFAGESIEDE
ncbi:MAG: AEC family transporter, partial [Ketobacteraceae bacterium]|nr:AEC family transporter [Ketobacteraceae bacterium]